jgi:hypothetical protein
MNLQSQDKQHNGDAQPSLGTADFYHGKLREILGPNLPKMLEDPRLHSSLYLHFEGILTIQQTAKAVLAAACQIKKEQMLRADISV